MWFRYTYFITIIYKAKIVPFLEQGLIYKILLMYVSLCYVLIFCLFEEMNLIVLLEWYNTVS
jgi:hypothetical protein